MTNKVALELPKKGDLQIKPISLNEARPWMAKMHRHLRRPVTGWLFGVQILLNGERIGVAMAARPKARMLQDGETIEIVRVATNGTPNSCSLAYGALRRAAVALGYRRVYTYTRQDEPGISVRAAGFVFDGEAGGGEATRPSRPRAPSEEREWCVTLIALP